MKSSQLTAKQLRCLDAIKQHYNTQGVMPTIREIQKALNSRSPRAVLQFLDKLEQAGEIKRGHGARNISLASNPPRTLRDEFALAALPWMLRSDAWDDYEDMAQSAYTIADKMMQQRSKEIPK
jgi:SOS-response transcriptional repressor LexA